MRSREYSNLSAKLDQYLLSRRYKTCEDIQSNIINQTLQLNFIGKKPSLFLTDNYTSIQFEFKNKNFQQQSISFSRKANNQNENNYYSIKQKRWHPFNCKLSHLDQQIDKNNPHHPYYYFKQEYNAFVFQKKLKKEYTIPCNKIKITKWRIKIVNISRQGWYAPIIEAIDYKFEQQTHKEAFTNLSCIMYQPQVKELMERLRLHEYRKKQSMQTKNVMPGLFYYLRHTQTGPAPKRLKNIYEVDQAFNEKEDNRKLKYTKDNLKFVLFGQSQGVLTLTKPIFRQEVNFNKISQINFQNMQKILNTKQSAKRNYKHVTLWQSDDSSDEEEIEQKEQLMIDEQSDSDDEDPLRNIYLKRFNTIEIKQ